MLAMQYSFTLPADYDMALIRERIASKGALMDGFPGLAFKAYLHTEIGDPTHAASENRYAPFYLWRDNDGMNRFLASPGFAALVRQFGWPSIRLWSVWALNRAEDLSSARWATREILPAAAHTDLARLRDQERALCEARMRTPGSLAALSGFEPTHWQGVRLQLWQARPVELADGQILFAVGHLSPGTVGESQA
ncbi:DUF4865 family protein [Niveibacterium terrae]|uniref:DUF4865 family protein n=1 Tax=Niveibacterium terrae TaxID=3373598 RepID=UPI003A90F4DE